MRIINLTKNTVLASKVSVADKFFSRLKGLLGRSQIDAQEALIIKPANSIHTFFMRFSIDVVFVNKKNYVIGLCRDLKPFRLSPIFFKAYFVIELPAATINNTQTTIGDFLKIEE